MISCGPVPDPQSGQQLDFCPPVRSVCSAGPAEMSICFDEEASLVPEKTRIAPALVVRRTTVSSNGFALQVDAQQLGLVYSLEGEARDSSGNPRKLSWQASKLRPHSESPPARHQQVLQPDHHGPPRHAGFQGRDGRRDSLSASFGSFYDRLVFPSFRGHLGEFVVVHLKPNGDGIKKNKRSLHDRL